MNLAMQLGLPPARRRGLPHEVAEVARRPPIARAPDRYTCADDPDTAPQALILPGAECRCPDGRSLWGAADDVPDGLALALAADRLRDTGDTLEALVRQVGYGSAFALSSAFKKGVRGQPAGASHARGVAFRTCTRSGRPG